MISLDDHLKEILAFECLEAEQRKQTIDRRCGVVYVIVFGVAAVNVVMVTFGISSYGLWGTGSDLGWTDRFSLFGVWMIPGGMSVWSLGKFRVLQSQLFSDPKPIKWLPLLAGIAGCVVLVLAFGEWWHKPISSEVLRTNDAWKFGLAWALLAWAYIFRP